MKAARQQGIGEQLDLFDEVLKAVLGLDPGMRHSGPGPGGSGARSCVEQQAETAWQRERALTRGLMERIASSANLNQADKRVKANRGAPGVDGMTVDDLRPWITKNKSLPRRRPGTRCSPHCSMGAINRNRCAGWKSPSLAAASANWASRRWSIVWSNRRCCKSLSRCSIRASRRRALASARDGERMRRCSEPATTSPTGTTSWSIWISKNFSTGSTTMC